MNEVKRLKIDAINYTLGHSGMVEIQVRFSGVCGKGKHQLILCDSVLDYQETTSKKKQSWQVLGIDGELFDFTASGAITLVNNIDTYYALIEEY